MSYIGRGLQSGAFRQLDDISSGFDGSDTTHTMQVNSTNVTVGDVNQILLSLGGVIQKPGTDFTVSSSTLTFTTAPAANTSFFAILLGSDNGGTVTPTDGSVTSSKLTYPFVINEDSEDKDFRVESNDSSHLLFVDGGNDKVLIDSGNSSTAPARTLHVRSGDNAVASFEGHQGEGLVISSGTDGQIDLVGYDDGATAYNKLIIRSNGSGNNIEVNTDGSVNMPQQPAFHVPGTTQDNIASGISTVSFGGTERFDQNADFNTSNYTFTAPVTGRYYFSVHVQLGNLDNGHDYARTHLVTSNHTYYLDIISPNVIFSDDAAYVSFQNSLLVDMDASDTAYVQINLNSGSGGQADLTVAQSYFSGFLAC